MEPTQLPPNPDAAPESDHLLEDLASFTGLFNPELIWQAEEKLDDSDEASAAEAEVDAADEAEQTLAS